VRLYRAIRWVLAHLRHHREIRGDIAHFGGGVVIKCGYCRREFGSPI
jgi:hypothetical protein